MTAVAAAEVRCAEIVVPREAGPVIIRAIAVSGASCETAHAVARRQMAQRGGYRRDPIGLRGFRCELVSDRQLECDRGRAVIGFQLGRVLDDFRTTTCAPVTLFRTGGRRVSATSIRRSPKVRCGFAADLLRASRGHGPLRRLGQSGTTYRLPNGWRCGPGAGGRACWNVSRPSLNTLPGRGAHHRFAVTADPE